MFKKFIIFSIIVLIASLAYIKYQDYLQDSRKDVVEEINVNLYTFNPNNIVRIEMKEEELITLQLSEDTWIDSKYQEIAYESQKVQSLINAISTLESIQGISNVLELKKYGIEETSRMITLYDEANNHYTLKLGSYTGDKTGFYVTTEVEDYVYVIKAGEVDALLVTRDDWINQNISLPTQDLLNQIKIIKKNEQTIIIKNNTQIGTEHEKKWMLEGFFQQSHELQSEEIQALIEQIEQLGKDRFVGLKENLSQYGLDEPMLTIELNGKWAIYWGIEENGFIYFMTDKDPYIYKMEQQKIKAFIDIKPLQLIRKQVYFAELEKLNQIILHRPEHTWSIDLKKEKQEDGSIATIGIVKGSYLDSKQTLEIIELIQNSICIEAILQNPEIEQKQERKAEIILEYHFLDNTTHTIELIPYDNQFYILRVEGIIEFAVAKQPVMHMINSLNEKIKIS